VGEHCFLPVGDDHLIGLTAEDGVIEAPPHQVNMRASDAASDCGAHQQL